MGTLSDNEANIISQLSLGLATISFLCSGFILYSYIAFPILRKFSFKLICMLAISDILIDISYFFGHPENGFYYENI